MDHIGIKEKVFNEIKNKSKHDRGIAQGLILLARDAFSSIFYSFLYELPQINFGNTKTYYDLTKPEQSICREILIDFYYLTYFSKTLCLAISAFLLFRTYCNNIQLTCRDGAELLTKAQFKLPKHLMANVWKKIPNGDAHGSSFITDSYGNRWCLNKSHLS